MNRTPIACALAVMMFGGVLYGKEPPAREGRGENTTLRTERGQARRASQGRRSEAASPSTKSSQRQGRQQAIANLKAMDRNGDGNISKSEATGKIARHFDKIDTSKDGFLSQEELKAMGRHKRQNAQGDTSRANPGKGRRGKK